MKCMIMYIQVGHNFNKYLGVVATACMQVRTLKRPWHELNSIKHMGGKKAGVGGGVYFLGCASHAHDAPGPRHRFIWPPVQTVTPEAVTRSNDLTTLPVCTLLISADQSRVAQPAVHKRGNVSKDSAHGTTGHDRHSMRRDLCVSKSHCIFKINTNTDI